MEKMIKKNVVAPAVAGALLLAGSGVSAGTVGAMNTFTAGTAAVADDVNANFTEHTTQINDNATSINNNANSINNNAGSISTMQTMAISDFTASVDCATQTIAGVVAAQPKWGALTVNLTGTCNENIVVERSNLKLVGGTINGADTSIPTVDVVGQQRVKLVGVAVTGGAIGVSAVSNSDVVLKNVTISGSVGPGLWITKSSTVSTLGNTDQPQGSISTGGTSITGGSSVDLGVGVVVSGNSHFHMRDATTTINAGGSGMAAIVNDGSVVMLWDQFNYTPAANVTGDIAAERGGKLHWDSPVVQSTITGNITAKQSQLAFWGTDIVGNVEVIKQSGLELGFPSIITGLLTVAGMSGAEIEGTVSNSAVVNLKSMLVLNNGTVTGSVILDNDSLIDYSSGTIGGCAGIDVHSIEIGGGLCYGLP